MVVIGTSTSELSRGVPAGATGPCRAAAAASRVLEATAVRQWDPATTGTNM